MDDLGLFLLLDHLKILNATPNCAYVYNVTGTDMSWVSTSVLRGDASGYNTSYASTILICVPGQTQSPTPQGRRLITVALYDTHGMAFSQHNDVLLGNAAGMRPRAEGPMGPPPPVCRCASPAPASAAPDPAAGGPDDDDLTRPRPGVQRKTC